MELCKIRYRLKTKQGCQEPRILDPLMCDKMCYSAALSFYLMRN